MRRLVLTGAILVGLAPAGVVVATTPDTTPPDTTSLESTETSDPAAESTMGAETVADDTTVDETVAVDTTPPSQDEPATIFDDSGSAVASVTVLASESAAEYEEGNEPEAGREYVRVIVLIESLITEGTFGIAVDDFILQDNNGFVTSAENVRTPEQAEGDEDITEEADLANGESVEFALTFEVVSSVGPQSVFYRPDDDRLVDIADIG